MDHGYPDLANNAKRIEQENPMRGLEEIIASNEDPSAYHRSREPQHGRHFEGADTNRSFESNLADKRRRDQAFHGERVEARQAERGGYTAHTSKTDAVLKGILADIVGGKPQTAAEITADLLIEMAATAAVLDAFGIKRPSNYDEARLLAERALQGLETPKQPEHQERIHSAIDAEPPFFKFWQKLNDRLARDGQPEAGYKVAREAFIGGPTPVGALTFIGKEWDGVRAVPAKSNDGRSYHGEFRQVSDDGTVWRVVANGGNHPIAYGTPEAALAGALTAKNHSEAHTS